MSDYTRTPLLGLYKPTYKADGENWGDHINWNADTLDAVVGSGSSGIASKLPIISVLDQGAKGDGTTDDTAAIQTTLNTYAGKAAVVIPATGNAYVVTGLSLPSNTDLILDGTVQMKAGTNIGGLGVIDTRNTSNVSIRGYGTIDGNDPSLTGHSVSAGLSADQTTNLRVSGITLRGAHFWNINLTRSQNIILSGVHSTGGGNANEFANACDNCWLMNCTIENILVDFGFSFYGGVTNSGAIGNTIRNCNVGIFVLSDPGQTAPCKNILIEGNIIYNSYVSAIAADLNTTGLHEAITITGNRIYDNNTSNQTAQAHIMIGGVQSCIVSDNMISGLDPVNSCAYGIRLKGCTDAVVTGNNIFNIGQASEPGFGVWLDGVGYVLVDGNSFHDYRGTPYMSAIGGTAGAVNRFTNNLFGHLTNTITATPQSDTVIGALPLSGGTIQPPLPLTGNSATALTITDTAAGSGVNGPATAQLGLKIDHRKVGWDTGTAAVGEIDGIYVIMRQGGTGSDGGGLLVDAQHSGTGFIAGHEYSISRINSGTLTQVITTQEAGLDGVAGVYTGHSYIAKVGTFQSCINIDSQSPGAWTNFIQCFQGGANKFNVDAAGNVIAVGNVTIQSFLNVWGATNAPGAGAYLMWNKSGGDGATWLLNQKGGGAGGIHLGEVSGSGVVTDRLVIDSAGHVLIPNLVNATTDAGAASGGVPVTGLYRNGSQLMVRTT